ncbi:MAG: LysE family transporter [Chitinophagaceae bacterium]
MFEALLQGLAIGLLLAISVGPVIFTVIKQSINNGKPGGFAFVAGVWFSDVLWIVIGNVFSELVSNLLEFKRTIGVTGSLFLISMGIFYLFFKKIHLHPQDVDMPQLRTHHYAKITFAGFLINTLNPAVMAFWLTSATALALTHSFFERVVIFSTCLAVNITADIFKVILAGRLRSKLTLKNIRLINKISGLILLSFGAALLVGVLFYVKVN